MRRGVFLDRDGTLVEPVLRGESGAVTSAFDPGELRLLPGALEGLRVLAAEGFVLAIATNQPGAAKGQASREAIARTNEALVSLLADEGVAIARVAACLHHPEGGPGGDASLVGPCACRKPRPGLLVSLLRALDLRPAATFMVGDRPTDVEAGRAAGVRTALIWGDGRAEAGATADVVGPRLDVVARAIVGALP